MSEIRKKKVAVLGGGCGAMTAAHYLSNTPELRERLEVTVYQMGWRLGGKGASGRDAAHHQRILEHGLHVWGGFYYNAFHLMRTCYGALGRPEGRPLRTWREAFVPHDLVVWQEQVEGRWHPWPVTIPSNDELPGEGDELPSFWSYVSMLVGWLHDAIEEFPHDELAKAMREGDAHHSLLDATRVKFQCLADGRKPLDGSPLSVVRAARTLAAEFEAREVEHGHTECHGLLDCLDAFGGWFRDWRRALWADNALRRNFILIDLGYAIVTGMLRDGLWHKGFFAIDDEDLVEWLARHGASQAALASGPMRGYYDYFFAYVDGDPERPRLSAAMGLLHLLRLLGTYKGTLFWKMASGMGDAVFGPLYEICQRNGVRFKFFHRVESLEPDEAGHSIAAVRIARQVDLNHENYEPLVDVKGLPSWPAEPRYDQINAEQADGLRARGVNLEDPWTNWSPIETFELKAGRDFDAVVLGISVGALGSICAPLIERSEAWRAMVAHLPTVQTQALQLWLRPSAGELGWDMGNATGSGYAQPLESWSDMTPVRERECWPPSHEPGLIVYFCGPQRNPKTTPDGVDPGFGREQTQLAERTARAWCGEWLAHLYPGMAPVDGLKGLRYELLVDPADGKGESRFAAQYVRSNYTPSERYVLDLPGTSRYRLEADTSGFDNLALAGDWLFTGLGGAVESAVISGMQAARALGGCDAKIVGEISSPWRRPVSVKRLV